MSNQWWIATLTTAGQQRHYATAVLSIEDATAGRWRRVSPGLSGGTVTASAPWLGKTPEERSTDLAIVDAGLDVPALLAQHRTLDGLPVEIALWTEGTTWAARQVLLSGQVSDYRYGAPGEPLEITATASVFLDRGLLPSNGAAIDATTWPNAAENATGVYPVVLGAPGMDGTVATPALMVESTAQGGARDLLLVAGHPVSATSVLVYDGSNSESLTIEQVADGAGRLVSVVDLASATAIAVDEALDYYCAWNNGTGLLPITSTGNQAGAGTVVESALAQSTLPIDRASIAAVRDTLNAYQVGAVITESISPAEWVADGLLPFLPVALVTGPKGWRFLPINLDAAFTDCAGTLTARRPNVVRQGLVTTEGRDEIANTLELRYAIDLDASDTAKVAQVDGASTHPTQAAILSRQIYGEKVRSEETIFVYDDATAYRILLWWARAYAFPRQVITYRTIGYVWIQPGMLVWLVDDELQIARPAWVQSALYAEAGYQILELVLWRTA